MRHAYCSIIIQWDRLIIWGYGRIREYDGTMFKTTGVLCQRDIHVITGNQAVLFMKVNHRSNYPKPTTFYHNICVSYNFETRHGATYACLTESTLLRQTQTIGIVIQNWNTVNNLDQIGNKHFINRSLLHNPLQSRLRLRTRQFRVLRGAGCPVPSPVWRQPL